MNIPQNIIVRLNELPIEEVAEKLGLEVRRHKALCFKHSDHNPSITPFIRMYSELFSTEVWMESYISIARRGSSLPTDLICSIL